MILRLAGGSRVTAIHLGPPSLTASCDPPDVTGRAALSPLILLRAGLAEPPRSPGTLAVSYTAVSPLPGRSRAVCFLWRYPAGHPGLPLATALPSESGLSSASRHMPRPSGQLRALAGNRTLALGLTMAALYRWSYEGVL